MRWSLKGPATSIEIQSHIANLLMQLQVLNQRLQGIIQRRQGVEPIVGREILGQAVGAVAESLFESSGVGDLGYSLSKKWARQKHGEQIRSEIGSVEYEFKQITSQVLELLSSVSVDSPLLKPPGNSDRQVRKMRKTASFTKPETRILRSIQFLKSLQDEKLILNSEIPEAVAARRPGYEEAHTLLRELEQATRKVIESRLSLLFSDWWTSRIPADVREKAEARRKQAVSELHPIHFVDFPDYVRIIGKRDNWREAFSKVFKDKDWISVKLRELEPIRNAVAHSRPLPRGGLERLRVNAKDIHDRIRA